MSLYIGILASQGSGGALLDSYGGAAAAFSLRKLSSTYGGAAVRVRRSLDNAEQDIQFAGGQLDQAALQAFVGYENLLQRSEEFENAIWTKNQSTITPNAGTDPFGGNNADRWLSDVGATTHYIAQNATLTTGQSYTISVWVKSNTASNQQFTLFGSNSLISPNLTATTAWQRFNFTFVSAGGINGISRISTNAAVDLLIFGAQLNQGVTAQPYQQTVATANTANGFVTKWYTQDGNGENLLLQSQVFEAAQWTKTDSSASANTTTAPDGTLTADTIIPSTTLTAHYVIQSVTKSGVSQIYTVSAYVKAAGYSAGSIGATGSSTVNQANFIFDLTTLQSQAITNGVGFTHISSSLVGVGNGWFRVSMTFSSDGTVAVQPYIRVDNAYLNPTYSGNGTSGLYVWGAQLSQSSWLQGYQATTTTAVSRRDASQATAASQPRIVNAGVIERENGKSAIYFNGSTFLLPQNTVEIFNNVGYAQGYTVSNIAQSPIGGLIFSALTSGVTKFNISNFTTGFGVGGRRLVGDAFASAIIGYKPLRQFISSSQLNYQTSDAYQYINGMLLAQNTSFQTDGLTVGTSLNGIGAQSDGTNGMIGDIQELLLYNTNTTPNTLQISQNQNSYFNVFWQGTQQALLDQFGGSAAAFSLRNLSSSYRGPLVRVRRSSDNAETDIGGTFSGDLDVNSLLAFTGGQNLLAYSQEFENAYWIKTGSTITANATIAPDGTLTADKLAETNTTSFHGFKSPTISIANTGTSFSIHAKAAERNIISVALVSSTAGAPLYAFYVDLNTGEKIETTNAPSVIHSSSVTNVGNGWYKLSITGSMNIASAQYFEIWQYTGTLNNRTASYLGVTGSGIYIWGAQLNTGVLQPYIPTTTAAINGANAFVTKWYDQSGIGDNLVLQSETFGNASWTKNQCTVSDNVSLDPFGGNNADKILENGLTAQNPYVIQAGVPLVAGTTYVISCYLKAAERNFGFVNIFFGATDYAQLIDLTTGSVVANLTNPSYVVENAGNGWWRLAIFLTASTTGTAQVVVGPKLTGAFGTYNTTANSGILIYGAQISASSQLLRYQPTTTAAAPKRDAVQTTAASQPRIVNAGSIESENGKPSMFYDGSNDNLSFSGIDVGDISYSVFLKNTPIDTARGAFVGSGAGSGGGPYVGSGGGNTAYVQTVGSTDYYYEYLNHPSYIAQFLYSAFATQSSSDLYINGNLLPAPSRVSFTAPTHLLSNIGLHISFYGKFNTSEAIIYASNVMSNRSSIDSNINSYYQIYWQGNGTALLDSYSGASAAYSLRNLSSAYTGPLIRVRRSSDNVERDIYGTFRGDLDLAALTSFVGANSGFVTTWYDQSGSGRHATQATAASQPRIVNAGAVDTQNGKPSMVFDGSNDLLQDSTNNPFTFTGPISFIHASYKNSTAYKLYETLFSAGTTGVSNTNTSRTIGFGYANNTSANPIPSIVTDIWSPSGVQQNGTVAVNQSRIVGYYISDWSTHRTAGQTSIRSNGVDLSVIPYGLVSPLALNTNPIKIGGYDTVLPEGYFAGSIFEMVAYASNQVASRVQIESNINNYYKIY